MMVWWIKYGIWKNILCADDGFKTVEIRKEMVYMKKYKELATRRMMITALLMLLQIGWWIILLVKLQERLSYISFVTSVLGVVFVLYLVNTDHEPSAYKMGWIIIIMLFPLFGVPLYMFCGDKRPSKKLRGKLNISQNKIRDVSAQKPEVLDHLLSVDRRAGATSRFIWEDEHFPVHENTEVTYYPESHLIYRAMLEAMEQAEHFIFLEFFIIEVGEMWNPMVDILTRKAKEGVEVKILYDDMGSVTYLPLNYRKKLESIDPHIKCESFNHIGLMFSMVMNHRDHRKILVIDGHTAFTGGINLSDRYININSPFGYWKDTGIRLVGDAVYNYTEMFLEMWTSVRPEEAPSVDLKEYMPHRWHPEPFTGQGFVQPYGDDPLDDNPLAENIYIDMLGQVKDYVYIFTPYLILSDELRNSLIMAAKRGVDVKIVTPGIPDKKTVYQVTRSNYSALLQVGIEIYEFTPGFIHAKSMVCDDKMAIVGTINWDFRSLFLHFECASWFYGCKAVLDVKRDVFETIGKSRKIEPGEFRPGWWGGCVNSVLRVFSPLL